PVQAVKCFVHNEIPIYMIGSIKSTAQKNTFFGFLISIGLLISYFR
ncbi:1,4-dihydroxy-2-naphthoate polyprenyltransferase, partial [Bacillus subtilis]|nr:1,4-dihydroxy-2-naphthoate polyprenyltransferase [Bacillus subtilis]